MRRFLLMAAAALAMALSVMSQAQTIPVFPPITHHKTPFEVLDSALAVFHGKPVQYAFDRLGYPDRKMTINGATIYVWINQDTDGDGGNLSCTVKVVVRKAKIASTDYHGNYGACALYASKLDPLFVSY